MRAPVRSGRCRHQAWGVETMPVFSSLTKESRGGYTDLVDTWSMAGARSFPALGLLTNEDARFPLGPYPEARMSVFG